MARRPYVKIARKHQVPLAPTEGDGVLEAMLGLGQPWACRSLCGCPPKAPCQESLHPRWGLTLLCAFKAKVKSAEMTRLSVRSTSRW